MPKNSQGGSSTRPSQIPGMIKRFARRLSTRDEVHRPRKQKKADKPSVFGGELSQAALNEKDVPKIIETCVKSLEKHGLDTEGLFRIPASHSRLEELAIVFSKGSIASAREACAEATAHEVAGFLKAYLKTLASPVIAHECHDTFLKIGRIQDKTEKMEALREGLTTLPPVHQSVLKYLLKFLTRLSALAAVNKMSPSNIAIVIGPTLFQPKAEDPAEALLELPAIQSVINTLVANYNDIYEFKKGHSSTPSIASVEDMLDDDGLEDSFGFGDVYEDEEEQFGFDEGEEIFEGFDDFDQDDFGVSAEEELADSEMTTGGATLVSRTSGLSLDESTPTGDGVLDDPEVE